MGCSNNKAVANQVHVSASSKQEALPAMLKASAVGRFQSTLPPSAEGRRDFARIFFANQNKIFVIARGMPSMRPIQPSTGPTSAHIGDLNDQVVERARALFGESLRHQLSQAAENLLPEDKVLDRLTDRAISSMTVNIALDFAQTMKLMPVFLQPAYVLILLHPAGSPLQARAATYGFVAEKPQQIQGDRPESKRTPFCVRLLSPDLLEYDEEAAKSTWEVNYSAMGVSTSTITQAVENDMKKVKDAISNDRWDPLLQ